MRARSERVYAAGMRCPSCGRQNPDDLTSCGACGARMEPTPPASGDLSALAMAESIRVDLLSPLDGKTPTGFWVDIYSPRWRDLATSLGGARDWDVFLEETLAPLETAFPGDPDLPPPRTRWPRNPPR